MKKQILVIHGGDSYSTHAKYLRALKNEKIDFDKMRASGWKDNLQKSLGNKFEVFRPQMPNRENARYTEWKIWFEKILPLMDKDIVLVGHSLGGIFLAKYLSENKIKKNIRSVFLVAAPFVGRNNKYDLFDFKLKNNFKFLYHLCLDFIFLFLLCLCLNKLMFNQYFFNISLFLLLKLIFLEPSNFFLKYRQQRDFP